MVWEPASALQSSSTWALAKKAAMVGPSVKRRGLDGGGGGARCGWVAVTVDAASLKYAVKGCCEGLFVDNWEAITNPSVCNVADGLLTSASGGSCLIAHRPKHVYACSFTKQTWLFLLD